MGTSYTLPVLADKSAVKTPVFWALLNSSETLIIGLRVVVSASSLVFRPALKEPHGAS